MALQRPPHGSIIHLDLPPALPAVMSGPLNSVNWRPGSIVEIWRHQTENMKPTSQVAV
jgi:hypothetical protein